jgi:Tol biopolymer transport system component
MNPPGFRPVALAVLVAFAATGCGSDRATGSLADVYPAWSRDGRWVAFTGDHGRLYVARVGGAARAMTDPGENADIDADWSPDGSMVVFARSVDGAGRGLYIVQRAGTGLRQLTSRDDRSPVWSPNGKTIAFTRTEGGLDSVRTIDLPTGRSRVLVISARDPAWSPDGSKVTVVTSFFDVDVIDLKSRRLRQVVHRKLDVADPAWSPDGRQIAFEDNADVPAGKPDVPGISEIYVVNIDGTGLRRLTRDRKTDWTPTWTPDGQILFASFRNGPYEVFVMNRDGTGLHRFEVASVLRPSQ